MRITLTLQFPGGTELHDGERGLDVTVDTQPGTPVHVLAAGITDYLRDVDAVARPDGHFSTNDPDATDRVLVPSLDGRSLHPAATVDESGLRNGAELTLLWDDGSWLAGALDTAVSPPLAVLRLLAGPDAGRPVPIHSAAGTIGSGPDANVHIDDVTVDGQHLRYRLGRSVELFDNGASLPVLVNGTELRQRGSVGPSDVVRVGASEFTIEMSTPGDVQYAPPGFVAVYPTPRTEPTVATRHFTLPVPPTRSEAPGANLMTALLILPAGLLMFLVTRHTITLIFPLLSPIALLGSTFEQRRQTRRDHAAKVAAYETTLAAVHEEISSFQSVERAAELDEHPNGEQVLQWVSAGSSRLWERRAGSDEFLVTRIGTGSRPSIATIDAEEVARTGADLRAAALDAAQALRTVDGMPITLDLGRLGMVALRGSDVLVRSVLRAVGVGVATTHGPGDVEFVALLDAEGIDETRWLDFLPHTSGPSRTTAVRSSRSPAAAHALLRELDVAWDTRAHEPADGGDESPQRALAPIVFVEASCGLGLDEIERLAHAVAERAGCVVWFGNWDQPVPRGVGAVVDTDDTEWLLRISFTDRRAPLERVVPSLIDRSQAEVAARSLAAFADISATGVRNSALPAAVSLIDIVADLNSVDDTDGIRRRWDRTRGLRAQLGMGQDGPVTVDLRRDGPHVLVAGDSGSGVSATLRSLVTSIALNNSPSRVNFLLIDPRDTDAFGACARLAHTVGVLGAMTSLQAEDALLSVRAELSRCEQLLDELGCRTLAELELAAPDHAPPALVVVVDGFEALSPEVGDLVPDLVELARRDRSGGLHLIFATQRPGDVVTDTIRQAADLRMSLRITDPADSVRIVGVCEAALIERTTPGRMVVRLGDAETIPCQAAYLGGSVEFGTPAAVRIAPLRDQPDRLSLAGPSADPGAESNLGRLVAAINTAATAPTEAAAPADETAIELETMPEAAYDFGLPPEPSDPIDLAEPEPEPEPEPEVRPGLPEWIAPEVDLIGLGDVLVGIDAQQGEPLRTDLSGRRLLIGGPDGSGKSSVLGALALELSRSRPGTELYAMASTNDLEPIGVPWRGFETWPGQQLRMLEHARRRAAEGVPVAVVVDDLADLLTQPDTAVRESLALTIGPAVTNMTVLAAADLRAVRAATAIRAGTAVDIVGSICADQLVLLLRADPEDGAWIGIPTLPEVEQAEMPCRGVLVDGAEVSVVQCVSLAARPGTTERPAAAGCQAGLSIAAADPAEAVPG